MPELPDCRRMAWYDSGSAMRALSQLILSFVPRVRIIAPPDLVVLTDSSSSPFST